MAVDIQTELSKEYPKSQIKQLNKGGTRLDYVPIAEVIARLNSVLGTGNWGEADVEAWRDQSDPDWIIARTTVWAIIDGERTEKVGFGGQKIKQMKSGGPVDLGDEFKGAHSDAFKKACQKLGVGLHLARDESAIHQEAVDTAVRDRADAPAANGVVKQTLTEAIEAFSDAEKEELKKQWKQNAVPRIDSPDFTQAHAELIAPWLKVKLP
jgi:hypothetical protein